MGDIALGSDYGDNSSNNSNCFFVKKLYEMCEDGENNLDQKAIIGWTLDGKAFEIKDSKRLAAEILPKYFRHNRFPSLVRQLCFYSFKVI